MNKIHLLDCTLRDGGYCNQWKFGYDNIKRIVQSLADAEIEIIECGFLTNRIAYQRDVTKYTTMEEASKIIPADRKNKLYVVMINYGEYEIENLPDYDENSVDGIRVAFHKQDIEQALILCQKIQKKGYKVFVQPMVSLNYTDEEFLSLIQLVNHIKPYAFYIVDSFGMMNKKNLIRLFYLVEHNLDESIWIGFHSHNNKQLAYSNAQCLIDTQTARNLIIDSSIFGMGRGAGNLNTELIVEYLNDNFSRKYAINPLLHIIDEVINGFYLQNYWGYSLPNYLSASHSVHPNYARYLADKNTLTVEAMDEIFSMMSSEKGAEFDKDYIEELYFKFMSAGEVQMLHMNDLKSCIEGKKVMLIAPGKSSEIEKEKIIELSKQDDIISVSVNYDYKYIDSGYIFISNLRRFRELDKKLYYKCITTSNIPVNDVYLRTRYYDLLIRRETIKDNAGMMAIKFFLLLGAKEILLAGYDGYSYDSDENYASKEMALIMKNAMVDAMNSEMKVTLDEFSKKVKIRFVTQIKHINLISE